MAGDDSRLPQETVRGRLGTWAQESSGRKQVLGGGPTWLSGALRCLPRSTVRRRGEKCRPSGHHLATLRETVSPSYFCK